MVRKVEAEGCGGTLSSGHEVRHVLQVLGREFATFLVCERLAVAPPRGDQQQPQELGQADRNQSRTSFGVGIKDWTFLAAFTAEEVRAPSAVAGETLERGARG
ncbi:hypothetical protein ACIA74_44950 [Streptomyces sp. NPDC051658]|uniref:hypothetical protein n=1 Tax=Streptomyces sp. NPDC051658 TaxID=3365667 RepID=UPI0037A482A2